jgi:hypothetical protein
MFANKTFSSKLPHTLHSGRDSNPRSSILVADAVTTKPIRQGILRNRLDDAAHGGVVYLRMYACGAMGRQIESRQGTAWLLFILKIFWTAQSWLIAENVGEIKCLIWIG